MMPEAPPPRDGASGAQESSRPRRWFWPFGGSSSRSAAAALSQGVNADSPNTNDSSSDNEDASPQAAKQGASAPSRHAAPHGAPKPASVSPASRLPGGRRPRHAGVSRQSEPTTAMLTAARKMRREAARFSDVFHPAAAELNPDRTPSPPQELVTFLRDCGAALTRAGEPVQNVQQAIGRIGAAYGLPDVRAFVVPTGVFVRIGDGPAAVVDFAPVDNTTDLRLDQIDQLYKFLGSLQDDPVDPREGIDRIDDIYAMPPRFPAIVRVFGYMIMTIALGLLTQPRVSAVAGYALLGLVVGLLREFADRHGRTLSLALPVVAAIVVTALAYRYSESLLGESPSKLLIPPLISFLPGSALTMGTLELATGSILSGASRLIYGLNVLILLAFGITVGTTLFPGHDTASANQSSHDLGSWAPWAGVLLLGIGVALNSSARLTSVPWLLEVLILAKLGQSIGTAVGGPLLGAFAGGLTLPAVAKIVERWDSAPPSQVMFLPAFWMLVPGSLSLNSIDELLVGHDPGGLAALVNALLTVVAVALGVMVGASAVTPTAAPAARLRSADDPPVEQAG